MNENVKPALMTSEELKEFILNESEKIKNGNVNAQIRIKLFFILNQITFEMNLKTYISVC